MMKLSRSLLLVILHFSIFSTAIFAKEKETNVLSYYAINNTIDGQPMIDRPNILRFYPVYTYRANIDTVKVTIYMGSVVYSKSAIKMDNGSYWEVSLPKFQLDQSIQRYEVETKMKITTDPLLFKLDSR